MSEEQGVISGEQGAESRERGAGKRDLIDPSVVQVAKNIVQRVEHLQQKLVRSTSLISIK